MSQRSQNPPPLPLHPAWIEINLQALRENFRIIRSHLPPKVGFLSVIKDNAYGHGAIEVAKCAAELGANFLGVVAVQEAVELRNAGITIPILLLGERQPEELETCLAYDLTPALGDYRALVACDQFARIHGKKAAVHLKIDTGMNRYGIKWHKAPAFIGESLKLPNIELQGIMSHFAMSDELDKTFALQQLSRFQEILDWSSRNNWHFKYRHICNSGGFLDLPMAHYDMVRVGILPLGVYPSKVCQRLPGIKPIMEVKAKVAFLKDLDPGETVGYGMRYTAPDKRTIAVIPVGYGDGFPRVRNQGAVLIHGKRAPLVGGVSMDAITVDVTHIPETKMWDVATLMGQDGTEEISIHDIAALKNSVSYDAMVSWKSRMPRIYQGKTNE